MKRPSWVLYSKEDKTKINPPEYITLCQLICCHIPRNRIAHCISLFEEGNKEAHDSCGKIRRIIEEGAVIDNWIKLWTPFLTKKIYVKEAQMLTLGIRLAKNTLDVYVGRISDWVTSTTIIEVWVEAWEVFWEKDTITTNSDTLNDKEDQDSQPISPLEKNYASQRKEVYSNRTSITKDRKRNPPTFTSNVGRISNQNKRGVCRNMVFKDTFSSPYLSLSNSSTNMKQLKKNHWKHLPQCRKH